MRAKTTARVSLYFRAKGEMWFVPCAYVDYVDLKSGEMSIRIRFPESLLDIAPYWADIDAWCLGYFECGPANDWTNQDPILWVYDAYVQGAALNAPMGSGDPYEMLLVELSIRGKIEICNEYHNFLFEERGDGMVLIETSGQFVKGDRP